MPDCMLENSQFHDSLRKKTDREIAEFTANEVHIISRKCKEHAQRIRHLEMAVIGIMITLAGAGIGLNFGLLNR